MIPDDFNYAATYSQMEDEELLEVASDSSDLVEAAKAALEQGAGQARAQTSSCERESGRNVTAAPGIGDPCV